MISRRIKDAMLGHVVKARSIKDSSYMESMVNFFHDIGQAYTNAVPVEEKESIIWVKLLNYESILDPEFNGSHDKRNCDDFLLLLGYKNGIQAWMFFGNGELHEVLSLRQGPVKTACLIPPPNCANHTILDKHAISRPLLAICMAADRKQLFTTVSILSLRTQDQIQLLTFKSDVEQIQVGLDGMLVITLEKEIKVFDSFDFQLLFTIKDCYSSPSCCGNPIALAKEWLVYSPVRPISSYQSGGGMRGDGISSYAATMISAAKKLKKGLVNLSETVNWLTNSSVSGTEEQSFGSTRETGGNRSRNSSGSSFTEQTESVPGLITVINVPKLCSALKDISASTCGYRVINTVPTEAVVAHFPAHNQPIVCMSFSPCGSLLATADRQGHTFHVFSILPHPFESKMGVVHHIYSLYRGDTSAKVQEISFSLDCRWICATTLRGTSHIFPVAAYGGAATKRTHVSHRVVNRSSLFRKSAGLEDIGPSPVSENHSSGVVVDGTDLQLHERRVRSFPQVSLIHNSTNPRLPPYPVPILVQPSAQIGMTRAQQVLHLPNISVPMPANNHATKTETGASVVWQGDSSVASLFTEGKLQLSGLSNGRDKAFHRTHLPASSAGLQCLLILNSFGVLTEYHLEPRPQSGMERVSEDSPVELIYAPRFQWPLQRLLTWNEVPLPLPSNNPLLEVDNRRRSRMNAHDEMSLSSTSIFADNAVASESRQFMKSTNADVKPAKSEKQATSYRTTQDSKSINTRYPGVAKLEKESLKTRNRFGETVSPAAYPDLRIDAALSWEGSKFDGHSDGVMDPRPSSAESGNSNASFNATDYDEWLAQVEMVSHEGPARRLWMGPQFCFKLRQSAGNTLLLSSNSSSMFTNGRQNILCGSISREIGVYLDEEMDLQSLKIPTRQSDPMPTPKSSSDDNYELNSITIEAGSGNFDRTAHMLEIGAAHGSFEDKRLLSIDREDKLRERIADAMQDSEFSGLKTRDIGSKSDSPDTIELYANSDAHLTVDEFDFGSEHTSLET